MDEHDGSSNRSARGNPIRRNNALFAGIKERPHLYVVMGHFAIGTIHLIRLQSTNIRSDISHGH